MMDTFISRAFLELATWVFVMTVLFCGMFAYGAKLPNDILKMINAVFALFILGFGVRETIGIIKEFVPAVGTFMTVSDENSILYIRNFLSSRLHAADCEGFLAWNPILHAITLFREGYYYGYTSHMLDIGYLYNWAIGSLLVAFLAEKVARKPIRNLI